jgi:hypothetical protein
MSVEQFIFTVPKGMQPGKNDRNFMCVELGLSPFGKNVE